MNVWLDEDLNPQQAKQRRGLLMDFQCSTAQDQKPFFSGVTGMVQSCANALALSETFAYECTIPAFQGNAPEVRLAVLDLQTRCGNGNSGSQDNIWQNSGCSKHV